ncbi:hypothetical protein N7507_003492 [Penicillium longicatenatum]|nr:hypothetical protein N7507_003492 [Penicillium longicatenatum]
MCDHTPPVTPVPLFSTLPPPIRLEQATAYIDVPPHRPGFYLGIATIARNGVRYFKSAVGTILEGLIYAEPWLHKVADRVLLCNASEVNIDYIRELELDKAKIIGREKALFNYVYLLKACKRMVPLDSWCSDIYRSKNQRNGGIKLRVYRDRALPLSILHRRFSGWNLEQWLIYFLYSTLAICTVTCLLVGFDAINLDSGLTFQTRSSFY